MRRAATCAALLALLLLAGPARGQGGSGMVIKDGLERKRVIVVPDGSLVVTSREKGKEAGLGYDKRGFSLSYADADANYAKGVVYQRGTDGEYRRADGTKASKQEHEYYEGQRNCYLPNASTVVTSFEKKSANGWYGYEKNRVKEDTGLDTLFGITYQSTTRTTVLGYQTSVKEETGSFVYENERGDKIRLRGHKMESDAKVTVAQKELDLAKQTSFLDLDARGGIHFGGEMAGKTVVGMDSTGGTVALNASAFVGGKLQGGSSATLKLPFGLRLKGGGAGYVSYGAGAEGSFNASLSWQGRFRFGLKGGVTKGIGGGGEFSVELDASRLVTGIDPDELAERESFSKIVANAAKLIEDREIRLRGDLTMSDFTRALGERGAGLTASDPAALQDFFAEFFEPMLISVELDPAAAVVPTGTGFPIMASVFGGHSPYDFTWISDSGTTVREGVLAARDVITKKPYEKPGEYTVQVIVRDGSKPKPVIGTCYAKIVVIEKLTVSLAADTDLVEPGEPLDVIATIAGGRPPYDVTWKTSTGKGATSESHGHDAVTVAFAKKGGAWVSVEVRDRGDEVAQTASDRLDLAVGSMAVTLVPRDETVPAGQSATLDYEIVGGEPPFTLSGHFGAHTEERKGSLTAGPLAKPGDYDLELEVRDRRGRDAKAVARVTVEDSGTVRWKRYYYDEAKTKLQQEEPFDAEDRYHGPIRGWDRDGNLVAVDPYRHGKRHGLMKSTTGNRVMETPFVDGERHGTQRRFLLAGGGRKLESECEWVNGVQHGRERGWRESGELAYEGRWENGERHGTWKYWDKELESGKSLVRRYDHGKLVSEEWIE